jgi:tRNA pseudouridine13 synthase
MSKINWPSAYSSIAVSGVMRETSEDFRVTEVLPMLPEGEGEHVWMYIEKVDTNTQWLARQLAQCAKVENMDVSYAGLKDRHAITQQWFSLYLPKSEPPMEEFSSLENVKILKHTRGKKKLRRGQLLGNKFELCLRKMQGDKNIIETRLGELKEKGFPNYFGEQRFGIDGNNLNVALQIFSGERKIRDRRKRSIYISAARSFIFNEVLAQHLIQDTWRETESGPMWGRGRVQAEEGHEELEERIAKESEEFCHGLEHAGLSQERRRLQIIPEAMQWKWLEDDVLSLSFFLPAGVYATALLKELGVFTNAQAPVDEDAAVE